MTTVFTEMILTTASVRRGPQSKSEGIVILRPSAQSRLCIWNGKTLPTLQVFRPSHLCHYLHSFSCQLGELDGRTSTLNWTGSYARIYLAVTTTKAHASRPPFSIFFIQTLRIMRGLSFCLAAVLLCALGSGEKFRMHWLHWGSPGDGRIRRIGLLSR